MREYPKIETLYERDPKTFKVRVGEFKNRTYTCVNPWRWTEKIDGTNIRVMWTPAVSWEAGGTQRVDAPSLKFGGRTDNAVLPAKLVSHLQEMFTIEKMQELFPDRPVTLYGEGYGAGIQKGGAYHPEQRFILFDVLVDHKWWLSHENVQNVATGLKIKTVPDYGVMTLAEATEFVRAGFPSCLANANAGTIHPAEGLVGRPPEALFDKRGHRLIVKLKTKDF